MELALLLRGHAKDFPVFPAFVASEDEEMTRSMADGDKVLASAVSQASAADCKVEPIKRVHNRPGRALILARKEVGAAHVVVPWDAAPSKSGGNLGRIIDELVDDGTAHLFLCRLPHPLGTCNRIVLLVPPGYRGETPNAGTMEGGFAAAAPVIRQVAKALACPLLLVCQESDAPQLEPAFPESSGQRTAYALYPTARMWLSVLTDHVREADLIIVLGARDPDPAFSSESRGMAQRLGARYPDNSLLVFYPANAVEPSLTSSQQVSGALATQSAAAEL
jgi:hypothetical protein